MWKILILLHVYLRNNVNQNENNRKKIGDIETAKMMRLSKVVE